MLSTLIAWLVFASGLINIISAIFAFSLDRFKILEIFVPISISNLSRTLSVVLGISLILISKGLYQRKKRAFYLSLIFLFLSVGTHLFKGLDIEELVANLLLFILLLRYRNLFLVKSNTISIFEAIKSIFLVILTFILYLYLGHLALSVHFRGSVTIPNIGLEYVYLSTGYGKEVLTPTTHQARWFHGSIQVLELFAFLAIVSSALAPFIEKSTSDEDWDAITSIVERLGKNSVSPLALMPDKSHFIGQDKTAVIAYRPQAKYAVVLGDPISYDEDLGTILDEFYHYCKLCGLSPIWYNCGGELLEHLTKYKTKNIAIGEDAIIDLVTYDLSNPNLKIVRNSVAKINRESVVWQWFALGDIPWRVLHDIDILHSSWIKAKNIPSMGFSLNFYPFPVTQKGYVLVSYIGHKLLSALSFFPYNRGKSYVLEMMIRAVDAPNGMMQASLDKAIEYLRDYHVQELNLGLAPNPPGNQKMQAFLSNWYKFRPLKEFKSQFSPTWQKKYLTYPNTLELPGAILAITQVHLGRRT